MARIVNVGNTAIIVIDTAITPIESMSKSGLESKIRDLNAYAAWYDGARGKWRSSTRKTRDAGPDSAAKARAMAALLQARITALALIIKDAETQKAVDIAAAAQIAADKAEADKKAADKLLAEKNAALEKAIKETADARIAADKAAQAEAAASLLAQETARVAQTAADQAAADAITASKVAADKAATDQAAADAAAIALKAATQNLPSAQQDAINAAAATEAAAASVTPGACASGAWLPGPRTDVAPPSGLAADCSASSGPVPPAIRLGLRPRF